MARVARCGSGRDLGSHYSSVLRVAPFLLLPFSYFYDRHFRVYLAYEALDSVVALASGVLVSIMRLSFCGFATFVAFFQEGEMFYEWADLDNSDGGDFGDVVHGRSFFVRDC